MSAGSFSVRNPVLVNILMITILIMGALSYSRLPREQFNEVAFYWVFITVPYPGASPFDVERTITIPIENRMDGLPRVREITSITREGLAIVQIQFQEGISREEFGRYYQEAQTRFNQVQLPQGVRDAAIDDFSSSDFLPVVEVILSGTVDSLLLVSTADRLRERLTTLDEVAEVTTSGARERQIRVDVRQSQLEALGLSLNEVVEAVGAANVSIPAGLLTTPSRQYLVRTVEEMSGPIDFENIIVRRAARGSGVVRLADIASIRRALNPRDPVVRYNLQPAVALQVAKAVGGSSVAVVDRVKGAVDEFRASLPAGFALHYVNDTTERIRDSIGTLATNALFGLVFLIAVLWFFVGIRNAFVIGLGIPLTFALTFSAMEAGGETLNSNSLFALVLVLGLIVDHAIVIIENCYRLRQQGLSRRDAAVTGTDEVVSPVMAATLTTVAAFLPLMLVPGIMGKFLRVIPLVVTIALTASTIEALVFLPVHFAEWSSPRQGSERPLFLRLGNIVDRLLLRLYRHQVRTVIVAVILAGLVLSLLAFVKQDLFRGEEYSYFLTDIELAPGAPRDKTSEVISRFEELLRSRLRAGEIRGILSTIGSSDRGAVSLSQDNLAQMIIELPERGKNRARPVAEVMREIQGELGKVPGPEELRFELVEGGPPVDEPVTLRFFGDDYAELTAISQSVRQFLAGFPSLYNIRDNLEPGSPELRVAVQPDRAAGFGLTPAMVGNYLRATFDGIRATSIFEENEDVDVIVGYRSADISSEAGLLGLKIPAPGGALIPFSALAAVRDTTDLAAIRRVDGRRQMTVTAQTFSEGDASSIVVAAQRYFRNDVQPAFPGVTLEVGGEFQEFQNVLGDVGRLFLIGIFLMYLILATQFSSYLQPVLILFAVPFAFVGVVLFLIVSGTPFSTTVMYAGVALAGIAVNDSIVLISFINSERRKGMPVRDAVARAVKIRLRPIVLTSATTLGGLLPTALGIGGYSPVWGPMAFTIIFGLMFSTVTTLLIVPCLYGLVDGISGRLRRGRRGRRELAAT